MRIGQGLWLSNTRRSLINRSWLLLPALALLAACSHAPAPDPNQVGVPHPLGTAQAQLTPTALTIPRLQLHSSNLAPMGLNPDGTIEVPKLEDLDTIGWYCPTKDAPVCHWPSPGEKGPAVIVAHVNGHVDGKLEEGPFANLRNLKVGDIVQVDRSDAKTATFKVVKIATPKKANFPTAEVYGDVNRPVLRLITCGGRFDAKKKSYESNVIDYLELVSLT